MRQQTFDAASLSPEQQAKLARAIMQRQAALSLRITAVFSLVVFGLPLVNFLAPGLANAPIFGFSLTWLFLGILFYPLTWLLSAYFVRNSDRIEAECARLGEGIIPSPALSESELAARKEVGA